MLVSNILSLDERRASQLPRHWIDVLPHIRRALELSGSTHDEVTVYNMLCKGEAQFWATETSFVVTEIVNYPCKRVMRFALAGGDLGELLEDFHDQILSWAREMGCVEAEFNGRLGWHKVLPEGWKQRSETCVRAL